MKSAEDESRLHVEAHASRSEARSGQPEAAMPKRPVEFCLAVAAIIVCSPLLVAIALVIWLEDRGHAFHTQERVGQGGKLFKMYKFRSMREAGKPEEALPWTEKNDPRVTRVGRILRKTGLDELPQLFNIARGDMSFVGPRPESPELARQFSRENPQYELRHAVRPGLTGLAQVYREYDTPAMEKLDFDLRYVRDQSLLLDVKVMLLTVWVIVKRCKK